MNALLVRLVLALSVVLAAQALSQEVTLEEVRVEAEPASLLEVPVTTELQRFVERLRLDDQAQRAAQLQEANKSAVTKLLDLTRYSPISLGSSDPRADTFFQQNYMRADLNPPADGRLFAQPER